MLAKEVLYTKFKKGFFSDLEELYAIEAMEEYKNQYLHPPHTEACGKSTIDGSYVQGIYKLDEGVNRIGNTPVHPWSIGMFSNSLGTEAWFEVPCSERLPEADGLFLVTYRDGHRHEMYFKIADKKWYWVPNPYSVCGDGFIFSWLERRPLPALPQYQIDYYENQIEMVNKIASQPQLDANHDKEVAVLDWILEEKILPRDTNWFDAGKHYTSEELYTLFLKSK